jgi:hypothetical protein
VDAACSVLAGMLAVLLPAAGPSSGSSVFYGLGATFIEGFVNDRTWHLIGTAEFDVLSSGVRAHSL